MTVGKNPQITAKEAELVQKGFSRRLAKAAVGRAKGAAEFKTREIASPTIRDAAFEDILAAELRRCEGWAERFVRSYHDGSGAA